MTLDELAKLVKLMRAAQAEYFRTRDRPAYVRALDLERRVDQAVAEVLTTTRQGSLFG